MANIPEISRLLECDANDGGALATAFTNIFHNALLIDTTTFVAQGSLADLANLQDIFEALEARIEALETP